MEIKMMEEEEMVPLNWDSLITNEGVFEYEELEETDPFGDTTKD